MIVPQLRNDIDTVLHKGKDGVWRKKHHPHYAFLADLERTYIMPEMTSKDPVFHDVGGWFFWDETWADTIGGYDTEEEARYQLKRYGLYLDGKLPEQQKNDLTTV